MRTAHPGGAHRKHENRTVVLYAWRPLGCLPGRRAVATDATPLLAPCSAVIDGQRRPILHEDFRPKDSLARATYDVDVVNNCSSAISKATFTLAYFPVLKPPGLRDLSIYRQEAQQIAEPWVVLVTFPGLQVHDLVTSLVHTCVLKHYTL